MLKALLDYPFRLFKSLCYRLSYFHITRRDFLNKIDSAPSYEEMFIAAQDSKSSGWYLMPAWKNLYHDDGIGWPELKFCHIDGREYIYGSPNKATPEYQLIKDDWRKGSYNYFPPIKNLAHENPKRFALYATNTILHLIFDLGPSYIPCIKKALNQRRR